jgi:hypothetical protein
MPSKKSNTATETVQSVSFDLQSLPGFQPEIAQVVTPPSEYEGVIRSFLAKDFPEGKGIQFTGTLSYGMKLVGAAKTLGAHVKVTWDRTPKGQKGATTVIRLLTDSTKNEGD